MSSTASPDAGDKGPAIIAISVLAILFTTICVGVRAYRMCKIELRRVEDSLLVIAYLILTAYCLMLAASVHWGLGKHLSDIPKPYIMKAMKKMEDAGQLQALPLIFAKISIGLSLSHLRISRIYTALIVSATCIAIAGNLQNIVIIAILCPSSAADPMGEHVRGKICVPLLDIPASCYAQGAANIVADLLFVMVPILYVRKVKFERRDKNVLYGILGFMLTATLASVLKMPAIGMVVGNDPTWTTFPINASAIGESALCIIAACLPSIRQVIGSIIAQRNHDPNATYIVSLYRSTDESDTKTARCETTSTEDKLSDVEEGPHEDSTVGRSVSLGPGLEGPTVKYFCRLSGAEFAPNWAEHESKAENAVPIDSRF